ncbi:MAG: MFS transporter [Ectothiorhodospiraceae bacterium]|jgi:YNFM family putative membrane transporter
MIQAGTGPFWRATAALCLGSFMVFCNVYATQPLLPMLRDAFAVSPLQSSLSLSVTTLTLGASLLLYGPLSDALGRKPIMVTTMVLATLCTAGLTVVGSFPLLLALRALQGFCLGGLPAVAVAYMGDEFDRRAMLTAVGLYIAGNSLGGISGRVLSGAVADHWGWRTSFAALTVLSIVCVAVFARALPPSRQFRPRPLGIRQMGADLAGHLRDPAILPAYLAGGLNFFIFVNLYSYITYRLSAPPYSLSPGWLGLLFLTYLAGTLASAVSGRVLLRLTAPRAMAAGSVVMIAGSALTLTSPLPLVISGLAVNALGFFLAHSAASGWVGRSAQQARASASSLYLLFYYVGGSTGSFYLDPFWATGGWPAVVAAAIAVLIVTGGLAIYLGSRTVAPERSADAA